VFRHTDWARARWYEQERTGRHRLPLLVLLRLHWAHGASPDDAYVHRLLAEDGPDPAAFVTRSRRHEFTERVNCIDCTVELSDKWRFAQRFAPWLGRPVLLGSDAVRVLRMDPVALGSEVVLKPRDGQSGARQQYVSGVEAVRLLTDAVGPDGDDAWIVEGLIAQHPILARLNAASVNTLRIVTFSSSTAIEVWPVTLRIGSGSRGTDGTLSRVDSFGTSGPQRASGSADGATARAASGGIAIAVGAGGQLEPSGRYRDGSLPRPTSHPVSGATFARVTVPHFDAACALAQRAAELLPGVRSIGWDVAITLDGPVLVEGNHNWGAILLEVARGEGSQHLLTQHVPDRVYGRRSCSQP
jgi:hypothetical protein